jgi:hypothetical protein
MKTWTPDASNHFEAWLGRARLSVAGDPSLDADDIAQDLRAHVHAELEGVPEPVTVGALERVLDSLGNPTQWSDSVTQAPDVSGDWFQRNVTGVVTEWQQKLAGDWGLPVLLLVITLLAIPTFDWVGTPLLLVAYFVARSYVTYGAKPVTGKKRLMVYFPLAIGAGVLAGLVLGFPLTLWAGNPNSFETLWVLGVWWTLIGILAMRDPGRIRSAMKPFAESFDASHGRMLSLLGGAFLIAASVMLLSR